MKTGRIILTALLGLICIAAGDTEECDPTLPNIEGPFYRTGAPERDDLYDPIEGPRLTIIGQVVGHDCAPIAGAWLDFWQADSFGVYDNTSKDYEFRGQQYADEDGTFRLVTNLPGVYPGRPKHLHVKVQGELADVLTTQLYFPGDPLNDSDPWHDRELELQIIEELPNGELITSYQFQLDEPGAMFCAADFNEDGAVDGEDLTQLLGNWGTSDRTTDINGDDLVDGQDLSTLLGDWGVCSP
jgi:protocatechuate 3,4-dioxygenase beta subunit